MIEHFFAAIGAYVVGRGLYNFVMHIVRSYKYASKSE